MKKILILSLFTPFENHMGSIRMRRIVKFLLDNGWEVCFFTMISNINFLKLSNIFTNYKKKGIYSKSIGKFKFKMILGNKKFLNLPSCKIGRVFYKLFLIIRSFFLLNNFTNGEKINKLYVSIPNIHLLIVAIFLKIARRKKIEIVEEIRDIYSLNKLLNIKRINRKLLFNFEKFLILKVDKFVFNTPMIKKIYVDNFGYLNSNISKGKVILNGFDPKKYNWSLKRSKKNKLTFTYAGSFYDSRNPLFFIRILNDFIKINKDLVIKKNILIRFICFFYNDKLEEEVNFCIKKCSLRNNFEIISSIKNEKVIDFLLDSNILLLITHEFGSEYAIPGKLFEYIGAKKPILAITNDILVKKIIYDYKLGWCSEINNGNNLLLLLNRIYNLWSIDKLPVIKRVDKFNINYLLRELIDFL